MSRMSSTDSLRSSLRGRLLLPTDDGYEAARHVWNGMIDKRPAAIVQCAGVADVQAAVRFGRAEGLTLAVRGGGHNVAGNATCDGGLLIDMGLMKSVRVDPAERTARAEAGLIWGEFDHATHVHGLATPGGLISTTGIAGLTLGGGFGYLSRRFGLACDNLLSVGLVTASGDFVTASATENADLFWGLRGGGGNFGIATSFVYRLHAVERALGGLVIYPVEKALDVLRLYRDVTAAAPDELSCYGGLLAAPDGTDVSGIVVGCTGDTGRAERAVDPTRALGPIMDTVQWVPYPQLQTQLDVAYPRGLRNYWKSNYFSALSDEVIGVLVDAFAKRPSPLSQILLEHFGGAVARVDNDATAFDQRDAKYNLLILSRWTDPAADAENIEWTRNLWNSVRPFSTGGSYVNYLGADDRVEAAYGSSKYAKLAALKKKYDPDNVFRLNQNIEPGAESGQSA